MVALLGGTYGGYTPVYSSGQNTATVPGGIAFADFNNDGKLDAARSSYENDNPSLARVVVAFGAGDGSFSSEIQLLTGNWAIEVDAGDIDGDGDADIICGTELNGVQVWKNNGNGTFGARASYAAGSINRQMELRDISGDGRPDIILLNETTNQLSVLINSGSGTFPVRATYATGSYPTGLAVADFDNDGDRDVAIGHRYTLEVRLFRNSGNGTLTAWQTIPNPVGSAIAVLIAGDFDGDSDSDLAVVGGYGATSWRFYTNFNGAFTGGGIQSSSTHVGWATAGLLDADSKPDLLRFETSAGSTAVAYRGLTTTCPPLFDVPDVYPTIQAAIDAAPVGTARTITVAPGTYNQSFSLNGKNIVVRGAENNQTILDGTGLPASIATFSGGEPATAGLENLVFRNGTVGSLIYKGALFKVGGAVYGTNSSAFIRNCRFEDNRSDYGGAVYLIYSSFLAEGCVFSGNTGVSQGGGMMVFGSTGAVRNCTFTANRCGVAGVGGGSAFKAAEALFTGETVLLDGCTITGNIAGVDGSAVEYHEDVGWHLGKMRLVNCTITGNTSGTITAIGSGGLTVTGRMQSCIIDAGTTICDNLPRNVQGPYFIAGTPTICDCQADLSGDGMVNGGDLGILLSSWGATLPTGVGDVNHDGVVNGADLAVLLSSWGSCP
jgi:hypothetical protein